MKKSKKVTIITIIIIGIIAGLLQSYHYCLNLSVDLPEEVDQAVTECIETMAEPDEPIAYLYKDVDFVFSASAYHAFGYTEDDTYIKVYGVFELRRFDSDDIKTYRDENLSIGDSYPCRYMAGRIFLAYLKTDEDGKIIPEKIWIPSVDDSNIDILRKMPIRTWLYIYLNDPKGYGEKLSIECQKKLDKYVKDQDISNDN